MWLKISLVIPRPLHGKLLPEFNFDGCNVWKDPFHNDTLSVSDLRSRAPFELNEVHAVTAFDHLIECKNPLGFQSPFSPDILPLFLEAAGPYKLDIFETPTGPPDPQCPKTTSSSKKK